MTPDAAARPRRSYGGASPEERDRRRREALWASALELFGTAGYAATSVERICSHASVSTRSFYELYAGREALFLALYDALVDAMAARLGEVVDGGGDDPEAVIRAAIGELADAFDADPRLARGVLVEVLSGGRDGEARRRAAIDRFVTIAADGMRRLMDAGTIPRHDPTTTVAVLVGGAIEVLTRHAGDAGRPTRDELLDELVRLWLLAFGLP